MKLLLFTHALFWWFTDAPELSIKAREKIADERQRILESGCKRLRTGDLVFRGFAVEVLW